MTENNIEQNSAGKSVLLHLSPGFLIGVCYFALVPVARELGYPSIAALMIPVLVVMIPFELGYLFLQGRKATGRFSLGVWSNIETTCLCGNTCSGCRCSLSFLR